MSAGRLLTCCVIAAIAALATAPAFAQFQMPPLMSDYDGEPLLGSFKVHRGGTFILPISKAKIRAPASEYVLLGEDARRFYIAQTADEPSRSLEAAVINHGLGRTIFYVADASGYVPLDDWAKLDIAGTLEGKQNNAAGLDGWRTRHGKTPLRVTGWHSQPTLDRSIPAASYALDLKFGNERALTGVAFVLGRDGYEKLIWVGDADGLADPSLELAIAANAFKFPPESGYADHRSGDPVASYGIAGLLVATEAPFSPGAFETWGLAALAPTLLIAAFAFAAWQRLMASSLSEGKTRRLERSPVQAEDDA